MPQRKFKRLSKPRKVLQRLALALGVGLSAVLVAILTTKLPKSHQKKIELASSLDSPDLTESTESPEPTESSLVLLPRSTIEASTEFIKAEVASPEAEQLKQSRRQVTILRGVLLGIGALLTVNLTSQILRQRKKMQASRSTRPTALPEPPQEQKAQRECAEMNRVMRSERPPTLNAVTIHQDLAQWLLEQSSIVVAVCRPDGEITLGNLNLMQLFSLSREVVTTRETAETAAKKTAAKKTDETGLLDTLIDTFPGANLLELCWRLTDREQAYGVLEQSNSDAWHSFGCYLLDRQNNRRWFDWQVHVVTPQADDPLVRKMQAVAHHSSSSNDQHPGQFNSEMRLCVGWENTAQQRERETIKLHSQLLQSRLAVQTHDGTIALILEYFCQGFAWTYAEAWVVQSTSSLKVEREPTREAEPIHDDGLLISKTLCYCAPDRLDDPIAKHCRTSPLELKPMREVSPTILNAVYTGQACYLPSLDHLPADSFSRCNLALASGLNTCLILPLKSNNIQLVYLLFAKRNSTEVDHAAALLKDLTTQMDGLFNSSSRVNAAAQGTHTQVNHTPITDVPAHAHINPLDSQTLDPYQDRHRVQQRHHLRSTFENTVEGLFQLSSNGRYVYANLALARILGYETPAALIAADVYIHDQFVTDSRSTKFERHLRSGHPINNFTAEFYRRDGSNIWIEAVVRVILDDGGKICGYEGSIIDTTDRQRTEDKLRYGATHDDLTGLWNRAWFVEQLQRILKRARRYDRYTFAVLFIDLDNFKLINDTLGHMVGDQLLVALAQRFNGTLQQGQSLARLGGDEFTLCIDRISDESEAIAIAQTLCQQLKTPFQIGPHQLTARASIGIVIGSRQYEIPEMVLKDADIAMYNAKAEGLLGRVDESRYVLFDLEMGSASQRRLRLEDDLRRAIEYNELSLYYQPIVDLVSMQTIGFEALLRWQHPYYGAISPAEFIPLAEKSGAIVRLGEWVLFQACQQLQTWKQQGFETGVLSLSVNVSSRQLSSGLITQIDQALQTYDIQPGELKVEITETVVMSDLNQAKLVLQQIKERQIPILLDDFGTGYCSLNYLYELPIDTLKIDRSFVRTIDERPDRRQVLDTIFQLADSLGMKVIAEGVENREQLAYLEQQQSCSGQGYLFSKPVPDSIACNLIGKIW